MPTFAYTARDATGREVTGNLEATGLREAQASLAEQALFPVKVDAAKNAGEVFRSRRVKPQVLATFYGQAAALMRSGVPMLRTIAVLKHQTSNRALADVLGSVHSDVEEGRSLPEAFARHPKVFGEMAINMTRAGAEGGFMEDALERVAQFTENQEDLKGKTTGALAYPAFLALVGVCVVAGLVVFVVPRFEELFGDLRERGELPALTEWLLWISHFVQTWWPALLIGAAVGAFYFKRWLGTESGRTTFDRLSIQAPLAGSILRSLAVARFCRVLGTLLHNGVPILRSLEISADAAGNRVLGTAVREAAENVSSGESLANPLATSGHFPSDVVEMIAVAEESNTLETVLNDIADRLEKLTWRRLDLGVRLLEPVMLLCLALVVLCVVIALLLPIMKVSSMV